MHEYGECKITNGELCEYCKKHPEEEVVMTVKGYYDGKYFHITRRIAREIYEEIKDL